MAKEQGAARPATVRLRPIAGVAPTTYIPLLYGLILAFLLFMLLVFPGLRRNGSQVEFRSFPPAAAVYVENEYIGSTPVKEFLPRGTYQVRIERPGFSSYTRELEIGGRLVGSLVAPRREEIVALLQDGDSESIIRAAAWEATAWGVARDERRSRPHPPVLSTAGADIGAIRSTAPEQSKPELETAFFRGMAQNVSSPRGLADLTSGIVRWHSGGGAAGPAGLAAAVNEYLEIRAQSDRFDEWLSTVLPEEISSAAADVLTAPVSDPTAGHTEPVAEEDGDRPDNRDVGRLSPAEDRLVQAAGHEFVYLPAGRLSGANTGGHETRENAEIAPAFSTDVEEFYLGTGHVTVAQFHRFLEENPRWQDFDSVAGASAADAEAIPKRESSERYLQDIDDAPAATPVRFVPAPAADAYAEWVTTQLGEEWDGYRVRLPRETELEYAALLDKDNEPERHFRERAGERPAPVEETRRGPTGAADVLGNLWSWTSDSAFSADRLLAYNGPAVASGIRVVRGGSWANSAQEIDPMTRGTQPEVWATPMVGFRLVLTQEDGPQYR